MKILYIGSLTKGTALHRMWALQRLGHHVIPFNVDSYENVGSVISQKLMRRTLLGRRIRNLNHDLGVMATGSEFDLVWFDKAQTVWPETVKRVSERQITTIHYSSDLPSSVRGDPGWRLFRKAIPHYHNLVTPSKGHFDLYRSLGAQSVVRMPFSFEPTLHFANPKGTVPDDLIYDATFIGTPYEHRPEFLIRLATEFNLRIKVFGDLWERHLSARQMKLLKVEPGCYEERYRESIWNSKICLGFVTHAMQHESARRWSEITACGGFLLGERTREAEQWFKPGVEAEFFSDINECAKKINFYLQNPRQRQQIAQAGMQKTHKFRSNDAVMAEVLAATTKG